MTPLGIMTLANCIEAEVEMGPRERKAWARDLRYHARSVERATMVESLPATRREIGIVAIDKKTGRACSGAQYRAGAKVYKSEAVARAALRYKGENSYRYVPAFIEEEAIEPRN